MLTSIEPQFVHLAQSYEILNKSFSTLDVSIGTIFHADLEKSYPSLLGCIFLKYDHFHFEKIHLISTYENNIKSYKKQDKARYPARTN